MREHLLHALDLGMLGDWDGAKRSLEDLDDPVVSRLIALFTQQQRRERERAEVQALARHELGNALAIAHANMEALVDGVLDTTPERLARIRDAMVVCGTLLDDLKKQYRAPLESHAQAAEFDICDLITSEVSLVGAVAESKNVLVRYQPPNPHPRSWAHYRGDRDRVALIVRDVLLGAVRFTPPGGSVEIRCAPPEVEFSVSTAAQRDGEALGFSVAAKLLDTLGGQARIVTENERSATFVLRLPTGPTAHDG